MLSQLFFSNIRSLCKVSGYHGSDYEELILLGRDAVYFDINLRAYTRHFPPQLQPTYVLYLYASHS
jgi:hypothetical protein